MEPSNSNIEFQNKFTNTAQEEEHDFLLGDRSGFAFMIAIQQLQQQQQQQQH